MTEIPFCFECEGSSLIGIIHVPEEPIAIGVLMLVGGGPQYRAGGHRQLVLWSRTLATRGIPVMRFDYRGVGDSGGEFLGFEKMESDLRSAINEFCARLPMIRHLVLWGECDASSAIMMHAYKDSRVIGISLQNPWARSTSGQAKTYLKHYYLRRLAERSFWKKVFSLRFNPLQALGVLLRTARTAREASNSDSILGYREGDYIARMKAGLKAYGGEVLLIMSGRDLIAREFDELIAGDSEWQSLIQKNAVRRIDLPAADHTFSSSQMRGSVIEAGIEWIGEIRAKIAESG